MTDDEKRNFANEAEKALEHEAVQEVIDELLFNLPNSGGGLVRYGIRKVARYAAIVARAQALGIDLDELRVSDEEVIAMQLDLARSAMEAGKPVFVVTVDETP